MTAEPLHQRNFIATSATMYKVKDSIGLFCYTIPIIGSRQYVSTYLLILDMHSELSIVVKISFNVHATSICLIVL